MGWPLYQLAIPRTNFTRQALILFEVIAMAQLSSTASHLLEVLLLHPTTLGTKLLICQLLRNTCKQYKNHSRLLVARTGRKASIYDFNQGRIAMSGNWAAV
jgi:hypothetical protein